MNVMTASEAKTKFGEALLMSQRAPVQISKHGKPVAVLVSAEDFVSTDELKLQLLQLRAERAREQITAGDIVDGEKFFDQLLQETDE